MLPSWSVHPLSQAAFLISSSTITCCLPDQFIHYHRLPFSSVHPLSHAAFLISSSTITGCLPDQFTHYHMLPSSSVHPLSHAAFLMSSSTVTLPWTPLQLALDQDSSGLWPTNTHSVVGRKVDHVGYSFLAVTGFLLTGCNWVCSDRTRVSLLCVCMFKGSLAPAESALMDSQPSLYLCLYVVLTTVSIQFAWCLRMLGQSLGSLLFNVDVLLVLWYCKVRTIALCKQCCKTVKFVNYSVKFCVHFSDSRTACTSLVCLYVSVRVCSIDLAGVWWAGRICTGSRT